MFFWYIREYYKILPDDDKKTKQKKRIDCILTIILRIEYKILLIPYYLLGKNKKYKNFIKNNLPTYHLLYIRRKLNRYLK
mgnify:CR=1 FL=1